MKYRFVIPLVAIPVVLAVGYFAISALLYEQLAHVAPHCNGRFSENFPDAFTVAPYNTDFDARPYLMPVYQTVSIPSQPERIHLTAWYIPAEQADAPAVIVVHGLSDCKQHPRSLLPAALLHRAGYHVLLIDLREHGDSSIDDGNWAGGTDEYLDVIAAWNWLVAAQHIDPARIGLFAYSGGTVSSLIAMQNEPRIAAAWLDSPLVDLSTTISDQAYARGVPLMFLPGGMLIARLHGVDLSAVNMLNVVPSIGQRPIFITHGTADQMLKVEYSYQLADAIRANGGNVDQWITEGTAHVRSMFELTSDYERRLIAFFDAHL